MLAYPYIGPAEVRAAALGQPRGTVVRTLEALEGWLVHQPDALAEGATFIVNLAGALVLAPRRSEHVACAGGEEVLAAGEIRFRRTAEHVRVAEVTNQSTGYCPDLDSWPAVAAALQGVGVPWPSGFTTAFAFRRCEQCSEVNLVKESWFVCAFCEAELPRDWNVSKRRVL